MEDKIKLKGIRAGGKLQLSGLGDLYKNIPPYFIIEIDLNKIEARIKGK